MPVPTIPASYQNNIPPTGIETLAAKEANILPSFIDIPLPDPAVFGVGSALYRGNTLTSDGTRWKRKISGRSPRVVRNLLGQTQRYPDATITGTATKIKTNITKSSGVIYGTLALESGSAGRGFWTQTISISADNWYALSFEVESSSALTTADGIKNSGGTATISKGTVTLGGDKITAGGVGRYAVTFFCSVSGTIVPRIGVGLDSNTAGKSLTLKNIQLEVIDPIKNGFCPQEYVYPGYAAAMDWHNNISIDSNNKVTASENKVFFETKPWSNILLIGDSRSDEPTNIGGQLDTLLGSTGVCIFSAQGGTAPNDYIVGFVDKGLTFTYPRMLTGELCKRTYSTDGNEEVFDYIDYMPFDSLIIADFGVNAIQAFADGEAMTRAATAVSQISTIAKAARAKGLDVMLTDNNPWKASVNWSAAKQTALRYLDNELRNLSTIEGWLWVGTYDLLGDATDIDKLSDGASTTPDYSVDGLHMEDAGSLVVATAYKGIIDLNK